MSTWTNDELAQIAFATELELSSMRKDGTLRNPVTIWVVGVGDDIYVRAVGGPNSKWFRHVQEVHKGHIEAGGVGKDVSFSEVTDNQDSIDEEYKSKYKSYGDNIVDSTLTPQAHEATLKLLPI
jgi:hypothetical protein